MCDNETLSEGMNESVLKRYGYVDYQIKQQTLEDDKLKSLKVIQKLQQNSNNNEETPRMKRFVYKSLIKKEDKSQSKYQESQLENLHQEFIQFKKEDLNQFDQHVEFSHFHKDKNISKVLTNFQKQQHSKPREQFYSKTRLGKTKYTHAINIIQNTHSNQMNNSHFKTIFNNK